MSTADWIMHAATHNAPPDRREWAHAMQAEFDTLEKGKLSWALGCWSAMARWQFCADAIYFLLLCVAIVATGLSTFSRVVDQELFQAGISLLQINRFVNATGFFPSLFLGTILPCAVISAYRPDRAFATGAFIIATQYVSPFIIFPADRILRAYLLWRVHYLGAPYVVALIAFIGGAFIGCQLGIAIHRLLHGKR